MEPFETRPLGEIGVEVLGLDLADEISEDTMRSLRSTIMDAGLALFRDQTLDPAAHVRLGQRFGVLENLGPNAQDDTGALIVIGNLDSQGRLLAPDSQFMKLISINEGWHTDSSFRPNPASFSLFKAVVVPPEGGDTFFASLERGWNTLGEHEQTALYGLQGIHDYAAAYHRRDSDSESGSSVGFDDPAVVHPLAREHPETGRTVVYVSEHVASVEGLAPEAGRALLDHLMAHCTQPDRVYRHRWSVGDFAIWDNRSMLHRAEGFDGRYARVMHHVRVSGDGAPSAARP